MGDIYDVIVIGGGPAGLTAAQYTSRAQLKTIILDKKQQTSALAYTNHIENYPGLLKPVSGEDLLAVFRQQALLFGAEYQTDTVVSCNLATAIKEVYGEEGTYRAKSVVIATGSMDRKADIPGESEYLGKGVSYCATCDAAFFAGLTVCVIGNSEEAANEAEHLLGYAKKVYLITSASDPGDHSTASAIKVITHAKLVSICGTDVVERICIKRRDSEKDEMIETDGVFIYLQGSSPAAAFLESDISKGEQACVLTHHGVETSIPGVYAAGDVTCSAIRQVVVSAAFGCIAALEVERYLQNRKSLKYDWAKLAKQEEGDTQVEYPPKEL